MTRANRDGDLDLAGARGQKDNGGLDGERQLRPQNLLAFMAPPLKDARFPAAELFFVKDDAKPDPKKAWTDILEKQLGVSLPGDKNKDLRQALLTYFDKKYDGGLAGPLEKALADIDKTYGSNDAAKELAKAQQVTSLLFALAKNDAFTVSRPDGPDKPAKYTFTNDQLKGILIEPLTATQRGDLAALKEFPMPADDAVKEVKDKVKQAQDLVRKEFALSLKGKKLEGDDKTDLEKLRKEKDSFYKKGADAKAETFGVEPHVPKAKDGLATQRMLDLFPAKRAGKLTAAEDIEYDACSNFRGSRKTQPKAEDQLPHNVARAVYIKARGDGVIKPGSAEEKSLVANLRLYIDAKEKGKSDADIKDLIDKIKGAVEKKD